jgi:predicted GH43/DUF377 family glycosyl hydrolase/YHS domain-containing protein
MKLGARQDLICRFEGNPIITKADIPLPCNTVFNAGATKFKDEYILLLRIEGLNGKSFFCLAKSKDGFKFEIDDQPVMMPSNKEPFKTYEEGGIEDPRISEVDGVYYIVYTAVSRHQERLAIVSTTDFKSFERIALISEPANKDGVLFPKKFHGRFARLDRPSLPGGGDIWISYSKDLVYWGDSEVVMERRPGFWDSVRIGAGAQPIETKEGWLEIYHGVKSTPSGAIYRLGCALFSLKNASHLIGRSTIPVLSPQEPYERTGDVPNVIFTCGVIYEKEAGELKIYYGAADTAICLGIAKTEDLIESCLMPPYYISCQVCGRLIMQQALYANVRHDGKDYPICSHQCMRLFESNPELYAKRAPGVL